MIISKRGGNGVLYNGMQRQQQVFLYEMVEWQRISSSYYVQHTCANIPGNLWWPYGIGQTIYIFMLWFVLLLFFLA